MSTLEKATHVCLMAAALVSIGLLIEQRSSRPVVRTAVSPKTLVGKHLSAAGVNWSAAPVNAAFFISTACHYCAASMPFYRKVAESRNIAQSGVALCVLSVGPVDDMKQWLLEQHVAVDGVYPAPSNPALRGTPTLLIVDSAGMVRRVFVGKLDASGEQEFLQIVTTGGITGSKVSPGGKLPGVGALALPAYFSAGLGTLQSDDEGGRPGRTRRPEDLRTCLGSSVCR